MITIYNPRETDFAHNGIFPLQPTECTISEELNGAYELVLTHPIDPAGRWRAINEYFIVRAPTPRGEQLFRVYKVSLSLNRTLTAHARHIWYDGLNDLIPIAQASEITPDEAVKILEASRVVTPGRFTASSDIPGTVYLDFIDVNPVQALIDGSDGLAYKLNGELLRDNFSVKLLASIGSDRGVQIRYRKNLTGLDFSIDVSDVETMVKPTGGSGKTKIVLPEAYMYSPYIDAYPFPLINVVPFSDVQLSSNGSTGYTTTAAAQQALRDKTAERFANGSDLPTIRAKVDFVSLGDTDEYREYRMLEAVLLGDTVAIIHEELGVSVKAKITRYTWDAIRQRYTQIEIGNPPDDIARVIGNAEAAYSIATETSASLGARVAVIERKLDIKPVDPDEPEEPEESEEP